MTKEQINIAIAESLGWKFIPSHDVRGKAVPDCWMHEEFPAVWADYPRDYCNDLNAMHEVEKTLQHIDHTNYAFNLQYICCAAPEILESELNYLFTCNATPLQRAEAYLRTIGKWKDE